MDLPRLTMGFLKWSCKYLDYKIEFIGKGLEEKCINKKNGKTIAYVNKKYFRKRDVVSLKGDYSLIKNDLNWYPNTLVKEIAFIMMENDIKNEWDAS